MLEAEYLVITWATEGDIFSVNMPPVAFDTHLHVPSRVKPFGGRVLSSFFTLFLPALTTLPATGLAGIKKILIEKVLQC